MFRPSRRDTFENQHNFYQPMYHMQTFSDVDRYVYRRTSTPIRYIDVKFDNNAMAASEKTSYESWKFNLQEPPKRIKVRGTSKVLPGIISGHLTKTVYVHIVNGKIVDDGDNDEKKPTRKCVNCDDINCPLNPKIMQQKHSDNLLSYLQQKFNYLSVKNKDIDKVCYCRPLNMQNILDDYVIIQ